VEEVAADLLAEIGANRVVRADQRLRRREPAVDRDVLSRGHPRHNRRKETGHDKGERNFGSQSHGREVPARYNRCAMRDRIDPSSYTQVA
jgi:hypothetical protein